LKNADHIYSHDQVVCPAAHHLDHAVLGKRGGNEMYEIVEVFEIGKAQDVIKSEPKESPFVDENGQLFRSAIRDEDEFLE
jgi:hypothetical protein